MVQVFFGLLVGGFIYSLIMMVWFFCDRNKSKDFGGLLFVIIGILSFLIGQGISWLFF